MDVIFSPAQSARRRHQGYTLIELITALAISSVVIAFAAPSFATLLQDTRLTTSINTLARTIHYTRSEAIKRNEAIILCKGTPALGCNKSQAWHEGWLVFVDENDDRTWTEDEPLLWTQRELTPQQTLHWSAFPTDNYLIYYPNGSASSNGTFTFCDNRGHTAAKALIIAKSGRARLSRTSASGADLQCES